MIHEAIHKKKEEGRITKISRKDTLEIEEKLAEGVALIKGKLKSKGLIFNYADELYYTIH
jgi:hypothetical protein